MEYLMEVRPKLKHNWVFLQTPDGLFVTGEEPGFHIKGKSIARWITALRPHMTGDLTLDQLCARLEPAQREHLARIIGMLLQRGVLKNRIPETSGILPEEVYHQFRTQIEYIDHFINYPQEHFKKFRESSILIYGSGESLKALALFLIRNGLKELILSTNDAPDDYLAVLEPEVNMIREGGSEIRVNLIPDIFQHPSGSPTDYDLVVYCSDNGSLKDIYSLNQNCVKEGRAFLAATPYAESMMLGPYVKPAQGPCWLCAMMRLSANSDNQTQDALWRNLVIGNQIANQGAELFSPVARRIGHGLGFELFKLLTTCMKPETEHGVIFQNLENLESSRSQLVRHPLCPVCSHFDQDTAVRHLEETVQHTRDTNLSDQELQQKHPRLFDQRSGIFSRYVDEDFEQLPLKRTRILGALPDTSINGKLDVTTFSLDTPFAARVQALEVAVGKYSQHIADRRGMVMASQRGMAEQDKTTILSQELSTWAGTLPLKPDMRIAWLPAFSIRRNSLVYVPAAAVYSTTALNQQGMFQRTSAGTAVGQPKPNTPNTSILSALAFEHLQEAIHGRGTLITIDIDSLDAADANLHFLIQSARRFARPFALKEVISDLPLSAVIAYTTDTLEQQVTTLGLELSGKTAVKATLQQLVGELQMLESRNQLPEAIEKTLITGLLTLDNPAGREQRVSRLYNAEMELAQLKSLIFEKGRDIIFVHTTSTDIWEEGSLISGTVLFTRPAK